MIPNLLNYSVPLNNRTLCELSIALLKQIFPPGYSFRMSSIPDHTYFLESRSIGNDTISPLNVKNTTNLPSVTTVPMQLINVSQFVPDISFSPAGRKIIKAEDRYQFPSFFLSLRMIADSALTVRKRNNCEEILGANDSSIGICILPTDSNNCTDKRDCLIKVLIKGIDSFATYVIGMFETVVIIISLLILLIPYSLINKELQTLPGKNVMCLSGTLMLTQILFHCMQIFM